MADVSPPLSISSVIRELEARTELLPEGRARNFVLDMIARLDREGDLFSATRKQIGWLRSLWYQTLAMPEKQEKPESRLQELKDRKKKLLERIGKTATKRHRANAMVAQGIAHILVDTGSNANEAQSARMRHARSFSRQFASNPILAKATKRG